MASIYNRTTVEDLTNVAQYLSRAAEQLTLVAAEMKQFGIEIGYFDWTQREWDAVDCIARKASQCIPCISEQILRVEKKRRTNQDEARIRRQELAFAAKKIADKIVTKKKPGRTKKTTK